MNRKISSLNNQFLDFACDFVFKLLPEKYSLYACLSDPEFEIYKNTHKKTSLLTREGIPFRIWKIGKYFPKLEGVIIKVLSPKQIPPLLNLPIWKIWKSDLAEFVMDDTYLKELFVDVKELGKDCSLPVSPLDFNSLDALTWYAVVAFPIDEIGVNIITHHIDKRKMIELASSLSMKIGLELTQK